MPIFRFICRACSVEFEDFRSINEKVEQGKCLDCGSGEIERVENLTVDCDCGCGCSSDPLDRGI